MGKRLSNTTVNAVIEVYLSVQGRPLKTESLESGITLPEQFLAT
jgi:hypothetical protein